MDPTIHILRLPLSWLALAAAGLIFAWGLSFLLLRSSLLRRTENESQTERNWAIPVIDSQSGRDSPFHRWDPRIKLASLVFFIFCAASLTQILWACVALLASALSVGVARIPFRYPLRRLAAMGAFLGMFLIVMPLTAPARSGDTLVVFEHLSFVSFNSRGLLLALLICLKASAIALMVEPLLATSPFPVTVQALGGLKTPPVICQMVLLAHRYIFVFQDEARRMVKGMGARGFRKRTDIETLRTVGNFLGMLLVRSFERTQRVHDAMVARGYNGTLPGAIEFQAVKGDWMKGAFWVAAGLAILAADRCCGIALFRAF
jgi:cobalt/nickel transport system permease protein